MGLAAGQARLLTITARKSDCEFQSMRLSHQKIALARELSDISNEYQNSLDQTKLIYDYYGTGDTNTPLSYSLMMTPSALNEFTPITLTDSMNRIVLNSKYAKAAEAAGIPREGLGTLPSDSMRNAFIQGLAGAGLITNSLSETIQGIPYNQGAGFGGGTSVAVTTQQGNYDEFVSYITNNFTDAFSLNWFSDYYLANDIEALDAHKGHSGPMFINNETNIDKNINWTLNAEIKNNSFSLNLGQLLDDDNHNRIVILGDDNGKTADDEMVIISRALPKFIDWLAEQFSSVLDLGDGYTEQAIKYAVSKVEELFVVSDEVLYKNGKDGDKDWDAAVDKLTGNTIKAYTSGTNTNNAISGSKDCMGFLNAYLKKDGASRWGRNPATGISLNNITQAFLTSFADFMNGLSKTDINGDQVFNVELGKTDNGNIKLAKDNNTFEYVWKVGTGVSSDDLKLAAFYDTLFNQICASGWTENNNVLDNEYLQQMLQGGMMYISRQSEDGFYYQGNYATDNYIKVVADESLIAQAEAKYTTEKAKLNAKEETLDLKMKNLDTEISSLTTEYDTVKNTISKNIEKSFKRYDA